MEKRQSDRKIDELLHGVTSERLIHHTCQFFEKRSDGFKPFGSAVLVLIHDMHFLLTASHVAEDIEEMRLFVRIGRAEFLEISGDIKLTDSVKSAEGIDLAYIRVEEGMVAPLCKAHQFLTIEGIRSHSRKLDGMHYCAIGFPETNIRTEEDGGLSTGTTSYFLAPTNHKPYKYYNYDDGDVIILEMKGKGTDIKTGKRERVNTHFHGISGCGLWFFMFNQDPFTGEYWMEYRLIGIMTEYKKGKYFCLVANKIHLFIEALVKNENMKFSEKSINPPFEESTEKLKHGKYVYPPNNH